MELRKKPTSPHSEDGESAAKESMVGNMKVGGGTTSQAKEDNKAGKNELVMEKSGPGDEKVGERLASRNEVTTQVGTTESGTCGNGGNTRIGGST
jgi:hypothetical protein